MFLVGLVDGTLPLVHAEGPAAVEEERRLLYVGVTRAREHLTLSWAQARSPGGRASRTPSRFLEGLTPRVTTSSTRGRAATPAVRKERSGPVACRVCGAALMAAVLPNPLRWSPAKPTRYIASRANVIQQRMTIVARDGLGACAS